MDIDKAIMQRQGEIASERENKVNILEKYDLMEDDLKKAPDYSTLKGFIIEGVKLYINYGNDSPALAVAIGQLFDNHCHR